MERPLFVSWWVDNRPFPRKASLPPSTWVCTHILVTSMLKACSAFEPLIYSIGHHGWTARANCMNFQAHICQWMSAEWPMMGYLHVPESQLAHACMRVMSPSCITRGNFQMMDPPRCGMVLARDGVGPLEKSRKEMRYGPGVGDSCGTTARRAQTESSRC